MWVQVPPPAPKCEPIEFQTKRQSFKTKRGKNLFYEVFVFLIFWHLAAILKSSFVEGSSLFSNIDEFCKYFKKKLYNFLQKCFANFFQSCIIRLSKEEI